MIAWRGSLVLVAVLWTAKKQKTNIFNWRVYLERRSSIIRTVYYISGVIHITGNVDCKRWFTGSSCCRVVRDHWCTCVSRSTIRVTVDHVNQVSAYTEYCQTYRLGCHGSLQRMVTRAVCTYQVVGAMYAENQCQVNDHEHDVGHELRTHFKYWVMTGHAWWHSIFMFMLCYINYWGCLHYYLSLALSGTSQIRLYMSSAYI